MPPKRVKKAIQPMAKKAKGGAKHRPGEHARDKDSLESHNSDIASKGTKKIAKAAPDTATAYSKGVSIDAKLDAMKPAKVCTTAKQHGEHAGDKDGLKTHKSGSTAKSTKRNAKATQETVDADGENARDKDGHKSGKSDSTAKSTKKTAKAAPESFEAFSAAFAAVYAKAKAKHGDVDAKLAKLAAMKPEEWTRMAKQHAEASPPERETIMEAMERAERAYDQYENDNSIEGAMGRIQFMADFNGGRYFPG